MPALDIGTIIAILVIVASLVGWEYRKMTRMTDQIEALKDEMNKLHREHASLLSRRDGENAELLRNLTGAIQAVNSSIGELTHYIRWLNRANGGQEPPPPLIDRISTRG